MKDAKNNKMPVCLTIAGLDPSGGAGIIADIKTFSRFGCFAAAAISSVTFQNTTGVFGAIHQTVDSVRRQVGPILEDYDVAALKTGMLPTGEIIDEVARLITESDFSYVIVDPVVRSTSGFDLIDDEALSILIDKLFPLADLVTPNIPEAERITCTEIKSESQITHAAEIMRSMGAKNILIKGGHLPTQVQSPKSKVRSASDYLFIGTKMHIFESDFIETTATHGTGCVLSSAIAANLALGKDLTASVKIAKDFVTAAIQTAPGIGHGHSPINI